MRFAGVLLLPVLFITSVLKGSAGKDIKWMASLWTLAWSVAVAIYGMHYFSPEQVAKRQAIAQLEEAKAQSKARAAEAADLEVGARVMCQRAIESLAKWDYDWVGPLSMPNFYETDYDGSKLIISGDSLKLQNGFGAWRRHSFRCTYDKAINGITSATVL